MSEGSVGDSLFEEGGAPAAAEADPKPAAAAESGESVADAVAKALEAPLSQLAGGMGQLGERLGAIEQSMAPKVEEKTADEAANELLTDPKAVIEAAVGEALVAQVSPLLRPMMEDRYFSLERELGKEVDTLYGEGKFAELFQEELQGIVKELPPNMKVSEKHVRSALDALKGGKVDMLADLRAKQIAQERTVAPTGAYTALGPGGPAPTPSRLNDEQKAFVAVIQRRNPSYTEKDYLSAMGKGISVDDWPDQKKEA